MRPSLLTGGVLASAHLLAAGAIWVCALTLLTRVTLLILLAVSLWFYRGRLAKAGSAGFVRQLKVFADGEAEIVFGSGVRRRCRLHSWYWHPHVVLVTLSSGWWFRRTVLITAGSAGAEPLRKLRLRLRVQAARQIADDHA